MNVYRVDRGHTAVLSGILVMSAGIAAFVGFVLSSMLLAGAVVVLLLAACVVVLRPPVVARLDEHGIRARRVRLRWKELESVRVEDGRLVLRGPAGEHRLVLATVGRRGPELVREINERMNTAHGYRRWDPTSE